MSRGPPGQGPGLPVCPLLPGQVAAPVHASVAPGPRHDRAGVTRDSHAVPRGLQHIGLSHPCHVSQKQSHRSVIIVSCHYYNRENCDVSNQKIKCVSPLARSAGWLLYCECCSCKMKCFLSQPPPEIWNWVIVMLKGGGRRRLRHRLPLPTSDNED